MKKLLVTSISKSFQQSYRYLQIPGNIHFKSDLEREKIIDKIKTGDYSLLSFTCTHKSKTNDFTCNKTEEERRSVKAISKQAYKEGVVLVKCDCEKLHLIADNLGWFGEEKNIEEILKTKGEEIKKISLKRDFDIA